MIFSLGSSEPLATLAAYLLLAVLRWRQYRQAHQDGLTLLN